MCSYEVYTNICSNQEVSDNSEHTFGVFGDVSYNDQNDEMKGVAMPKPDLTERQQQILDFLVDEVRKRGYPPSVREIGEGVGLSSPSTVHNHLANLESKGYIHRDPSKPRAIEIDPDLLATVIGSSIDLEREIITLPLVGQVAAGAPIVAEQNIEDQIMLPTKLIGDLGSFMLEVRGDSMIDAGILSGDYVIVRETPTARNGEIVVALIDDEATVKTYYRESDRIRLQPENENMDPIYVSNPRILGVVIGLFRAL